MAIHRTSDEWAGSMGTRFPTNDTKYLRNGSAMSYPHMRVTFVGTKPLDIAASDY